MIMLMILIIILLLLIIIIIIIIILITLIILIVIRERVWSQHHSQFSNLELDKMGTQSGLLNSYGAC